MTSLRRLSLALALVAAAAGGASAQSRASQTVTVSTATELVRAIASNRTIVLKKGDYDLRSAYRVVNKFAVWADADDGKELGITKVENLTIRGADGARIVSDSSQASIVGVYDSSNVTFDNVAFVREPQAGAGAGAGSVYAESVHGFALDRCAFEGETTTAIELWECEDVSIKRSEIADATSGLLSASYTKGLELSASRVTGCEGYPLLYLEESDNVAFKGNRFEGGSGGNFVELYAESGEVDSVAFDACVFKDNQFEYFSGSGILPTTTACSYSGNSFGEDWETASVAPSGDERLSADGEEADSGDIEADDSSGDEGSDATSPDEADSGPLWYGHDSGLSFSYPQGWDMKEYKAESRVGVFAPDGKSLAFFLTAYLPPANLDAAKQAKKLFADSAAALAKTLKEKAGLSLSLSPDGEPFTANDLLSADYKGKATKGDGETAEARIRFVVTDRGVDAMVALAPEASAFEPDGELDAIFKSIETTQAEGD